MAREELLIEIDASGRVRVETHGIKGKRCLDYVELFRTWLAGDVEDQTLTPEYNQADGSVSVHATVEQHVRRNPG